MNVNASHAIAVEDCLGQGLARTFWLWKHALLLGDKRFHPSTLNFTTSRVGLPVRKHGNHQDENIVFCQENISPSQGIERKELRRFSILFFFQQKQTTRRGPLSSRATPKMFIFLLGTRTFHWTSTRDMKVANCDEVKFFFATLRGVSPSELGRKASHPRKMKKQATRKLEDLDEVNRGVFPFKSTASKRGCLLCSASALLLNFWSAWLMATMWFKFSTFAAKWKMPSPVVWQTASTVKLLLEIKDTAVLVKPRATANSNMFAFLGPNQMDLFVESFLNILRMMSVATKFCFTTASEKIECPSNVLWHTEFPWKRKRFVKMLSTNTGHKSAWWIRVIPFKSRLSQSSNSLSDKTCASSMSLFWRQDIKAVFPSSATLLMDIWNPNLAVFHFANSSPKCLWRAVKISWSCVRDMSCLPIMPVHCFVQMHVRLDHFENRCQTPPTRGCRTNKTCSERLFVPSKKVHSAKFEPAMFVLQKLKAQDFPKRIPWHHQVKNQFQSLVQSIFCLSRSVILWLARLSSLDHGGLWHGRWDRWVQKMFSFS